MNTSKDKKRQVLKRGLYEIAKQNGYTVNVLHLKNFSLKDDIFNVTRSVYFRSNKESSK